MTDDVRSLPTLGLRLNCRLPGLTLYYVVALRGVGTSLRNRDRSHKEGQPSDSNSATRTRPLPGSNFVVAIRVFETK